MKIDKLPNNFAFTHHDDATESYTCECVNFTDDVLISWELGKDIGTVTYSTNTVLRYLNDGTWINFVDLS